MKTFFMRWIFSILAMAGFVALTSCGGGGGDPGTPILTNPPTIKLVSLAGNAIPPNQTVVLRAQAFDQSGRGLAGVPVNFSLASNGTQGALSATTATTDADGVAQVLYTAGPQQGSDIINATVTGAQSKTGTASLAMQVGVNPNAGPQVTVNLQTSLSVGQPSVAPNSTVQITADVASNGQPVANQPVDFSFGLASSGTTTQGPSLNGSTTTVTATTDSNGKATVTYQAGPQAGVDSVIATYSQNNVVLGIGSVSIAVQASAEPTWKINLSGTVLSGTVSPSAAICEQSENPAESGLSCKDIEHNTIQSNGIQTIDQGAELEVAVTDKQGNPVPNAVVLFSLGSVSTSTGLPYCAPPAMLNGGVCHTTTTGSAPAVPDTAPLVGNVNAGFASATSTVVPTITAVTDAKGIARARYVSGGGLGTDIVLVTAGYNTGTPQTPAMGPAQGTQSGSMVVSK